MTSPYFITDQFANGRVEIRRYDNVERVAVFNGDDAIETAKAHLRELEALALAPTAPTLDTQQSAITTQSTAPNPLQSLPTSARRGLFRFLVADQPGAYWAILSWLGHRRHVGELEVDLEALRDAVPMERELMAALRQLEEWGNLTTRIEPWKIRTLEDRRVERYRVSLGEETDEILEFASQEQDEEETTAELAEDLLRSLEAGLDRLLVHIRASAADVESAVLCDASSLLRQLRREATGLIVSAEAGTLWVGTNRVIEFTAYGYADSQMLAKVGTVCPDPIGDIRTRLIQRLRVQACSMIAMARSLYNKDAVRIEVKHAVHSLDIRTVRGADVEALRSRIVVEVISRAGVCA